MAIKKKRPETIGNNVSLDGPSIVPAKFNVVYHNLLPKELQAMFEDEGADDDEMPILRIIKSWDWKQFELTAEGIAAAEEEYPGLIQGLISNFHALRQVRVVGNFPRR